MEVTSLPARLRQIPKTARISLLADDGMGARIVAIGRLAHEAADALMFAEAEVEMLRGMLRGMLKERNER